MQIGSVATPFGSRSMTLAMLANQIVKTEEGKSVEKWKLYRSLCEARVRLGVSDRALALLNALLTFYPKDELSADDSLIVFPSNAQLSVRAHGMAEQTIRRHLAVLVELGLISRKDSANGKRFARRDREGGINDAFGFNLAPLLARADEINHLAAQAVADRLTLQRLKEDFTICRRDVAKLIAAAVEEDAEGDWETLQLHYRSLVDRVGRSPTAPELASYLEELKMLRQEIINILEMQANPEKPSGNDLQIERHIQNSNTDSHSELEPRFEKKPGANFEPDQGASGKTEREGEGKKRTRQNVYAAAGDSGASGGRPFPLGMVLRACPQIADYAPGGIGNWRDLMAAAVVVRSTLGVSPSAYQDACEIMGPENAATVIACILERAGHINSAGGYLRDLTKRAHKGEFSLGPVLMALLRAAGAETRRAG